MKTMQGLTIDVAKEGWETSRGFVKRDLSMPTLDEKNNPSDALCVIVRVMFAGMCGSDRGMWNRDAFSDMVKGSLSDQHKSIRIVGHEFVGEVVAVGSLVESTSHDVFVGSHVSGDSHVTCGKCYQCRLGEEEVCRDQSILGISIDGIYAEYVKIPAKNLWAVDFDRVRPEVCALYDPFGNAVHALSKVDVRGARVAIFGTGQIGMFSILLARYFGAAKVIAVDTNSANLEMAKRLGAHETILIDTQKQKEHGYDQDPEVVEKIKELTYGKGVDVSMEMAGFNSSVNNCLESTRYGGHIILFGIKDGDFVIPNFSSLVVKGFTLHNVIGRQIFKTWQIAQRMLSDKTNGIQDAVWEIMLNSGNGPVISIDEFSKEVVEEKMKQYPKLVFNMQSQKSSSMNSDIRSVSSEIVGEIKEAGLYKSQRVMASRQGAIVNADGQNLINFCSNNYLGLAGRQELVDFAKQALDTHGYGLSSVRFICGTQTIHQALEKKVAEFLHKDAAISFTSCWDANESVFASLLTAEDAIISDSLNHASIIDGIRLCKAERHVFDHMNMQDLEEKLQATQDKRLRCVVTDGVFSMDGDIAPLKQICELTKKYNAYVVVDDSHATGFLGATGRGSIEEQGVLDMVDVVTTTFGTALGGANGGAIAGPKEFIELLHQRARTTLFTNTLPPVVAATTMYVLDLIDKHPELRERVMDNTRYFRSKMVEAGFTVPESVHPIIPIMLGDGKVAQDMARDMLDEGIYVIGFSYPVVPKGKARIRVQMSAAHSREQIDQLVHAFVKLGQKYGILEANPQFISQ